MKKSALILAALTAVASAQPRQPAPNGPGLNTPVRSHGSVQLNAQEMEALKDVEAEHDKFVKAAEEHDKRLRELAKHEFDERTQILEKRYAERVAATETDRKTRHASTIALLEKFLHDHPNHETYTPDKMYQLADLYLDRADTEVEEKLAAQEASGQPPTPENAAIADYTPALELWQGILEKFPNYRQTPATLYLLAYYGKGKDERKSLQLFLSLACANHYKWNDTPPVMPTRAEAIKQAGTKELRDKFADCQAYPGAELELVRHAWVRGVADYEFSVPGELDESIAAYLKVANGGNDSKLYAESLYKLAWSYYKRDRLRDSIQRFDDSVKLYDSIVASGGTPALELRDESIQYIAVAFTDPWEGEADTDAVKAFARAKDFYKGRENEPHVRDVWVALGKAFTDLQAYDQAIDAYRVALGPPWELNPQNPLVHQDMVNVYELKGDKLAADNAAAELATKYACPTSAWCQANEKDREAMENQRRLAERALYAAARNTHSAATLARKDWEATRARDPQGRQDYLALYAKAVELYGQFIDTYPDSDYVYEFTFLKGEALYWDERYPEAVAQYKWVRDHKEAGTAYYLDAARSVVETYEAEAAREVTEGKIAQLKVPSSAELKALPQPMQPQPIPEIYAQLQAEYDNYQNNVPDPAVAPKQGMNAALISLAYLHVDDATSRLGKVMKQFCHTPPADPRDPKAVPPATNAKNALLAVYEATGQLDQFEATNRQFIQDQCGDKGSIDLAISQNRSLNFLRANELYKKKDYVAAGDAFYKFYKTAAQTDPDLPTALYNSAVSYKLGERPKTAIAMFKEFTSNPAKNFRQSSYYLDSLRLTAASQQAAFDYDSAIKTYLALYDTTKQAKKLGIKAPDPLPGEQPLTLEQIGRDALFNAAFAAELNRDFKQAAALYGQYQGIEPDRRKQDRAQWSIANLYKVSGDANNMVEALDRWRARYGKDAGNEDDYVQSFYDTSQVWKRKGQQTRAEAAGKEAIEAWKKKGSIPKERGAKLAGEWAVYFAEQDYTKNWEPYEIKRPAANAAQIKAQGDDLKARKKKIEDVVNAVDVYGVPDYSMFALVRFGDIQYDYAQKVAGAPIPTPIANVPSAASTFQNQLDQLTAKYLGEAKTDWMSVLDAAKKNGIANQWSRHALENLGREFPQEFTPLRQEIITGTDAP